MCRVFFVCCYSAVLLLLCGCDDSSGSSRHVADTMPDGSSPGDFRPMPDHSSGPLTGYLSIHRWLVQRD